MMFLDFSGEPCQENKILILCHINLPHTLIHFRDKQTQSIFRGHGTVTVHGDFSVDDDI